MLRDSYPYYLANRPEAPNQDLEVLDKYRGDVATRVALADEDAIDRAIAAAVRATEPMARLAAYERQSVLMHCVDRFTDTDRERFAMRQRQIDQRQTDQNNIDQQQA